MSVLRLTALPLLQRAFGLVPFPLFESTVLVVQPEVASGKPPLHCSAECRSPTPAVGVAGAFAVAWIVDSLNECSLHAPSVTPIVQRVDLQAHPSLHESFAEPPLMLALIVAAKVVLAH